MKITIVSKGPWIVEMYNEVGKKLCKEDADALWGYMISSLNTTQYPEDDKIIINKTEKDKTIKLLNEIIKEEDETIEYIRIYEDANNITNAPDGDYKYMIEFFSEELIDPKEDTKTYSGHFSEDEYNGKYIRDCMKLINKIEQRAKEIENKYFSWGCDVSIGDFNIGCQYGMAIYVWVPEQK